MLIEKKDPARSLAYLTLFFVIALGSWSNAFFSIFSILFMLLSLVSVFRTRDFSVFKSPLAVFIAVFIFMNLVSLTQTHYLDNSLRGVFKIFRSGLLCLSAVYVLDTEDKFRKIFHCELIVASLIGLDALIQGVTGHELLRQREMIVYLTDKAWRVTGPFRHANDFSAYLSLMIFFFLGALGQGWGPTGRKRYFFYWVGLAVTAGCLLWTYSRGAWIAVALAFGLMAWAKRSRWLWIAMIAVCCWAVFLSPPLLKTRMLSLFNPKAGTAVERVELWKESLRMIRAKPLFGHGPNTYSKNEPFFKSQNPKVDNQYAHNGYLHMAAEIGLLGLVSFLWLIFYFFKEALPAFLRANAPFLRTAGLGIVFGILAFLIHSATDTDLQSLLLVNKFWLALGTAWAAKNCLRNA
ncbi:MAG: O-antigen ligase family protein [Candidatus Omnitrophica bacterium]|nr:O-antigen ligase family protein [Candidatus Omnitrophota bacterium]